MTNGLGLGLSLDVVVVVEQNTGDDGWWGGWFLQAWRWKRGMYLCWAKEYIGVVEE